MKKNHKITILLFVFLFLSCIRQNEHVIIGEDFNIQKLEPINKSKSNTNFYVETKYENQEMTKLSFFDKSKKRLLHMDTIYYKQDKKYLVNESDVKIDSNTFKLIKISFHENNNKISRHFLIKSKKKYYLIAVEKEIKPLEFEIKKVNTNSYCLEFKSIQEYIENTDLSQCQTYYFKDFYSFKFINKKEKIYYRETYHYNWGNNIQPNFSELNFIYNNIYLSLNFYDNNYVFFDSSILKCIRS
ncbi:hypothetical protein V3468_00005 [Flavobacterium oreochromis]|uniref:Lipoprotein n=1 Tax=Flavobacterium oreochromis TaxID=2906078 RepID=A0ABW8P544_9FLAO|nr:hypothetical protein [Flavobacterium oreochromis]OWP74761.1 hypothetical protein BWG23_12970 [Flavobacterium oreochromis]